MKSTREVAITFCLLALVLRCDSAQPKLKSLSDLKTIDFGKSVPKHSLVLLHWFANAIDVDNNDILLLTFDPNRGSYGSHHYGNYEAMLDPLPRGYRYYTVGNLHQATSSELPQYVRHPPDRAYRGTNMDRIIFRVQERISEHYRIDRVFITQHFPTEEHQGTRYDPEHTYHITIGLLQQMRQFSVEYNPTPLWQLRDMFDSSADDVQLRDISNIWGESLAWLGLLLFIVNDKRPPKKRPVKKQPITVGRITDPESRRITDPESRRTTQPESRRTTQPESRRSTKPESRISTKPESRRSTKPESRRLTQPDFVVDISDEVCQLEQGDQALLNVVQGKNGKALIVWRNVSWLRLKEGVAVVLFNNERDEASSTYKLITDSSGSYQTSVLLNDGLQVRLHRARRQCFFWTKVEEEICRGEVYTSPAPVFIRGQNAYLQLFVKDGKACARLYVSSTQWRSQLEKSWVGFYDSEDRLTDDYKWWQWQWVIKFRQGPNTSSYDTYEYCSGMTVAPGVHARFILRDYTEIARTPTLL